MNTPEDLVPGELFVADDADNQPTIWEANGAYPKALLRVGDLPPLARRLWPHIVAAVAPEVTP